MSGRSSWCFTGDHPGCVFAACTCACHRGAAGEPPAVAAPTPVTAVAAPAPEVVVLPVPARPVPGGTQAQLGFPDSIDGSTDDVVTVTFSLRGQDYEVDLSRTHRQQLAAALGPYVAAARPDRTRPQQRASSGGRGTPMTSP